MAERIVSMHAAHRSGKDGVDGFLSRPTASGERTAIVLVHGYRGLDDGQRAVTRRFAQEGFVCLSPNLFHGKPDHGVRCRGDLLSEHVSRSGRSEEYYSADAVPLRHRRSRYDPNEIEMFRDSLDRHKNKYQIEKYPGAGHAFLNNPSSNRAANRDAAGKSVASTAKWLRKLLS